MRILFLGNNYNLISVRCLQALLDMTDVEVVVGLYSPGDGNLGVTIRKTLKSHGLSFVVRRGMDIVASSVSGLLGRISDRQVNYRSIRELTSSRKSLQYFDARAINSTDSIGRLNVLRPDLIVVAAFSQILKAELLGIPRSGCINMHPSLLPKYRGPNPFYWVLENREVKTGVTVHYIDEGIDTGDIILSEEIRISDNETESTLREKSIVLGAELLVRSVRLIRQGKASRTPQDESLASYYSLPPRGQSRL